MMGQTNAHAGLRSGLASGGAARVHSSPAFSSHRVARNLGSRSLYILSHFEGPRFIIAVILSPILGFLIPLLCFYLDKLDLRHWDTLGYKVTATKSTT